MCNDPWVWLDLDSFVEPSHNWLSETRAHSCANYIVNSYFCAVWLSEGICWQWLGEAAAIFQGQSLFYTLRSNRVCVNSIRNSCYLMESFIRLRSDCVPTGKSQRGEIQMQPLSHWPFYTPRGDWVSMGCKVCSNCNSVATPRIKQPWNFYSCIDEWHCIEHDGMTLLWRFMLIYSPTDYLWVFCQHPQRCTENVEEHNKHANGAYCADGLVKIYWSYSTIPGWIQAEQQALGKLECLRFILRGFAAVYLFWVRSKYYSDNIFISAKDPALGLCCYAYSWTVIILPALHSAHRKYRPTDRHITA
jgi:hypothetical protein